MSILLTDRPVPLTLTLIDAVEQAAQGPLDVNDVQMIVSIVRDPRPAIPHTVWVARILRPTRRVPADETIGRARDVIRAVRAHDARRARGEV